MMLSGTVGLFIGAVVLALGIPKDNSLERMVVSSDPEVATALAFKELFPAMP